MEGTLNLVFGIAVGVLIAFLIRTIVEMVQDKPPPGGHKPGEWR